MILVDANVLLYAYHPRAEQHESCRRWLESALSGPAPVGLPWPSIWAFLRIATNPRAFTQPLSIAEAREIVSSWLEVPSVVLLGPAGEHWRVLGGLLTEGQVAGPLVTDAVLAAIAREHGATICTTDRDFARFEVETLDPTRPRSTGP